MITTYALTLTTANCNESQRIALIDLVSDWMIKNYPLDERGPGTFVRVPRESSDDPVFRLTITESDKARTHVETFSINIVFLDRVLTFDIRIVSTPTSSKVAPYMSPLVQPRVAHLVRDVLNAVPTEDANQFITDVVHNATTELEGQNIAAFIEAPSRRLPVVIEIANLDRATSPLLAVGLGPLIGLVHIFHITSKDALKGFLEYSRYSLVGEGCVIVQWAGKAEAEIVRTRELPTASYRREYQRLVQLIIDTAARSIATPRVPPPPRAESDITESPIRTSADDFEENEDQAIHIEQLEATIDELQASMTDADRMMAELRELLEKKGGQVDELILRNVSLEIQAGQTAKVMAVPSMTEALRLAQINCPQLVFHERAIESGSGLEGPEPVSVLQDLVRLNEVARAWRSGEIKGTSIMLACRQMGLDFTPTISDTARQKYEEDYLIDWRGRTVRAEAHLRRGRKIHLVRIHVYFDNETQDVVVAYIGRHLRDKGSPS